MTNENFESKLTPAAKEVLDELIRDYRFQLLWEASKSASDVTGEVREISVRDILDTLQKVESPRTNKRDKLIDRLLIFYAIIGIAVTLVSFILTQFDLTSIDLSISIAITGSFLAFASLALYYLNIKRVISIGSIFFSKRDVAQDTKDYSMFFIMKWREIEILSREVVSYYIGESNIDNISIRDLLNNLIKFDVINQSDSELYLKLLEKRNSVVHAQTLEMSATEYKGLEIIADTLLKKLRNKKESTNNR